VTSEGNPLKEKDILKGHLLRTVEIDNPPGPKTETENLDKAIFS
jgi:hypothetical protein